MLAFVPEMLSHRSGIGCTLHAQQRWSISGGSNHDRAGTTIFTQNIFDKLLDLAPPLANESHHDHIRTGVTGHHSKQYALANPRAREQAQTLTTPYRQQRVDRTNASIQRLPYRIPIHGIDLTTIHGFRHHILHGPRMIQRKPLCIHHTAQQPIAHRQAQDTCACYRLGDLP